MRILVLCLFAAACSRSSTLVNHDPRSPEITGLERIGEGAYKPGSTEHFRVIYSVDQESQLHFSASAGQIVLTGDDVAWTLPDADEASLTVGLETKTKLSTSTFHFRLG